jgi:hypothetical protein
MGLFKKKPDPINERARSLNARIAELENQIQRLSDEAKHAPTPPRIRSTTIPSAATSSTQSVRPQVEPVFVEITHKNATPSAETVPEPALYNDLGVRKYNLFGAIRRWLGFLRGPSPGNPKLVNYLAAGNIQGLKPLRYEKRIARNRFLFLAAFFVLLLWGILAMMLGRH